MNPADLDRKIRAAFQPRSLGTWPTPLQRSDVLAQRTGRSEVWVKREDRSSRVYGGNKVRSLEFLLADVAHGDAVMTIGGWGSTHCLATARHARALGAHAVVAQFPQGSNDSAVATASATSQAATACFRARSWPGFPAAWIAAWRAAGALGPRRYVPGGGAGPAGVLGQALATLELGAQLPSPPDAIVTPLGSGGTAAGILLGCEWLSWPTRVVAVRVAPRVVANAARVHRLAAQARRLLRARNVRDPHPPAPELLSVVSGLGRGYGHPTEAGEAARGWGVEAGLVIDSTYGGKTLAAVAGLAWNMRRVVYWHTYAGPEGGQ